MNTTVGFVWKLFPSHIKLFITGYVLVFFLLLLSLFIELSFMSLSRLFQLI